ncbi:hypothetical protein ABZP36_003970 [Zizania latifolia]
MLAASLASSSPSTSFLLKRHSDHYASLGPSWSCGLIFCSALTACLLVSVLSIRHQLIIILNNGVRVTVDGWGIVVVDANHCLVPSNSSSAHLDQMQRGMFTLVTSDICSL